MRSSLAFVVLSLTVGPVIAQHKWPDCIQSCITNDPVSDQCNGDETGDALDRCTCASFDGSSLIDCVKDCPKDQQSEYASVLPDSCRSELLPGADSDGGGSSSSASGSATGSTSQDVTSTGEPQSETSEASATTNSDSTATPTSSEGGGSEATSTDGAVAHVVPTILAAAGIVAGLIL